MGEQKEPGKIMTGFLEVHRISKKGTDGPVLKDISFTQQRHQKIAIAGETGSGKSTLLKIISGLEQADGGTVTFEGERVRGALEQLVPGHPRIAYLSQHFELPKFLRVEQVLSYSNTLGEEHSENLYRICQIEHLLKRKTDQLSGGERQRIALARNLITGPALLLLDEPFSNLDVIHKNTLKDVLTALSEDLDITLILVSHDADDSLPWSDTILVMKEGEIIQRGMPQEVYDHPVNEYAAGLFGRYNLLNEKLRRALGIREQLSIIRPEWLELTSEDKPGISVVIKSIRYYGSFREAEVESEYGNLIVYVAHNGFAIGQRAIIPAVRK